MVQTVAKQQSLGCSTLDKAISRYSRIGSVAYTVEFWENLV